MKKVFLVITTFIFALLLTGCGSNYSNIKNINYSTLEKKLKSKDTFILEVAQDGCHNCESFTPKFNKVLKKYKIEAFVINQTKLKEEEVTKLTNLYNVTGTPTVIFINDGKEISISRRIVGDKEEEQIISKLKVAGYIK